MAINKKQLRQEFLKQRLQIPQEAWQIKSQELSDRLIAWDIFQQAQNILAFTSFRQEPDLSKLWQNFPHKNWGFSRCVGQDLVWHQVAIADFDNSMRSGKYGICEPIADLPTMDLDNIDLILIPAIATDADGYRLGYGGGFYDRWLPQATGIKVGIIFDEFYLDKLPHDIWDIPLEAIVTDQQLIQLQPRNFSRNF